MPSRSLVVLACCAVLAAAAPASAQEPSAPRIDAATPLVQLGREAEICVCGSFPTSESARALRLDGRPLEIVEPVREAVVIARLPRGLAPGLHTVKGMPAAGYRPQDEAAVRVILVNEKVCRRPFNGRRVHFMIAGSTEPVRLRVRNLTPDRVRLAGDPVHEVTTSGGRDNQEVLEARVLRSGRWKLNATLDAPRCPCAGANDDGVDPERRDELARDLAESLTAIERWFETRAAEARAAAAGGAVARSQVRAILEELEARLLQATAAPELAGLRAWVEDELAEERNQSAATRTPSPLDPAPGGPGLALVLYSPAAPIQGGTASPSDFTTLLQRIRALFADLRRVSIDLVVTLCVRSSPPRADVWVQPKRYPPGRRTELTDTDFENLTRGVYVGGVDRPGEVSATFEADLVSEIGKYVFCDLEEGWCDQAPEPPGFSCREAGGRE